MNPLPFSESVDVSRLVGLFRDTTASYKFFYLLALLGRVHQNVILLEDLAADMVLDAWFPAAFCRLSFGLNDSLQDEVRRIQWGPIRGSWITTRSEEWDRLRSVAKAGVDAKMLMRFVPYRLLRPFFVEETEGLPDQQVNERLVELSQTKLDSHRPLYRFSLDGKSISLEHNWQRYLSANQAILVDWTKYHLAIFLQKRNPMVPGILEKLVPPLARAALTKQNEYWRLIQSLSPLFCPYTRQPLDQDFSLDHVIPWSFVGHDRLWNLVPVAPSANWSKSDRLPHGDLFDGLLELHHHGLLITREALGAGMAWERITEPFVSDLRLPSESLLDKDRLAASLRTTWVSLMDLAQRQGFQTGWRFAG